MHELIICEKPSAALKVAQALANGSLKKHSIDKVYFYEIKKNNKTIFVASAVGHLFVLAEKNKKGWTYPVFDIAWKPAYEARKKADFTKKYYDVLYKLSKDADSFVIACDFDIEGSLIGYNCLRFIAQKKDAKRMKFSTMTKEDLLNAYENLSNHLDFPQIESGETRHILDFFYGISLSRALTLSIKEAGSFKIMSIGRVQGPALALLSKRELEIKKFKPEPYWEIELITDKLSAFHEKGKFNDKNQAADILKNIKGKPAIVNSIKRTIKIQKPPHPFDLTSLQIEAYKQLGFTPKQTLQLAQNLYIAGFISYPRTSSQKLPLSLGYKKILDKLSKRSGFAKLIKTLPKKLTPNEGKKTDSAHP
ncbi:MAG: DNA topoisomerase, partial [Nanoarchaeota archaeon]